jgi:proteasome lid subunit RPN8/RPN11
MSRSKTVSPEFARALVLTPHQLAAIVRHAEAAYPNEACGLLVGRHRPAGVLAVTRAVESENLAAGPQRDSFEVDPALRFRLERALRGSREAIIGHYHSHPDHPARPSARDLAQAHEPELAWLIIQVEAGEAAACAAFRLDGETRKSRKLELRISDGTSKHKKH